jgi:hypothetical protein
MNTTDLTITRVSEDIGPDSFIVKGKLGSAYIERGDKGLWHINQRTGGDSREARTNRDDAMLWAITLCSTVFIKAAAA